MQHSQPQHNLLLISDPALLNGGRKAPLMLRNSLQDAMATTSTAVPRRVFSIATSRTLLPHDSFHQLSPDSVRLYSSAAGLPRRIRKSRNPSFRSTYSRHHLHALIPRSGGAASFSIAHDHSFNQARSYASQTDGLSQSDTFREYRLRQEIEQRRRAIRELEDDLLRSEINVADARLHLNLQELATLPV